MRRFLPTFVLLPILAAPLSAAAAGDVKAVQKGGTLVLIGDAESNGVWVSSGGPGIEVSPNGSTVNGGFDAVGFSGVTGISARLGAGNDTIQFDGFSLTKNLSADGGPGNNSIDIHALTIDGNLSVKNGSGADTVSVQSATVLGGFKADSKDGGSLINLFGSSFGKGVQIKSKDGFDDVRVDSVSIGGGLKVQTGKGPSQVTVGIGSSIAGNVQFKGGNEADEFRFEAAADGKLSVALGNGANIARLDSSAQVGRDLSIKGGNDTDDIDITLAQVTGRTKIDLGKGPAEELYVDSSNFAGDVSIKSKAVELEVRFSVGSQVDGDLRVKSGAADGTEVTLEGDFGSVRVDAKGPLDARHEFGTIDGDLRLRGGGDESAENDFVLGFCNVTGDVSISSKDAKDVVRLESCPVSGGVTANLGSGDHEVRVEFGTIAGDLRITAKDGASDVGMSFGSEVGGALQAKLGDGDKQLNFESATVQGKTLFQLGDGETGLGLSQGTLLGDDLDVRAGSYLKELYMSMSEVVGDLVATSKSGPGALVAEQNSIVQGDLLVDLGPGPCMLGVSMGLDVGGDLDLRCDEASGETCDVFLEAVSVAGDTRIETGAASCGHTIADGMFAGLELETGGGNDQVWLDVSGGPPQLFDGPVRIRTGAGDDFVMVGEELSANAACTFQDSVLFDGGAGAADVLDHLGHGNAYNGGGPTVQGFTEE